MYYSKYAEKLIEFRGSLRVAPPSLPPVFENPRLAHERTSALWEGLRRVYFGELERDDVPDRRRLPSREVFPDRSTIDDLRREIDELEARIARRRRMTAEDDGHPSLDIGDGDSDDDSPPASQGEGGSTSRATPPGPREPAQIRVPNRASTDDPGEQIPSRRSRREAKVNAPQAGLNKRRAVKDRWFYEPVLDSEATMLACFPPTADYAEMMQNLGNATDKYEAAIAMQPEANPRYRLGSPNNSLSPAPGRTE